MGLYLPVDYLSQDSLYVKSMGYEDNAALAHWGPGYRKSYILHYVTAGRGFFNGQPVCRGQGFFISSSQLQEYHPDDACPWSYFWIIFSREGAEKYVLPLLEEDGWRFSYSSPEQVLRLKDEVFSRAAPLSHTGALAAFFSLLSLHLGAPRRELPAPLLHLRRAKAYIEAHLHQKITVRETARAVHLNERYLYNLFIRHQGVSIKEYLDGEKLTAARRLLSGTALSVTQVAASVGFEDVCAFSRFFSRREGLSPTAFRESCQNSAAH